MEPVIAYLLHILLLPNEVMFYILIRTPHLQWKSDLKRRAASLVGDNLVLYFTISASEVWPDQWDGLSGSGLKERGS